jgi:YidC/Oxa1 family membrane protein insertase
MESKRFILALILSAAVLFLWQTMFVKPPPEQPTPAAGEPAVQDQRPVEPEPRDPDAPDVTAEAEPTDPAYETIAATAERTERIETDLFEVELSNRGGRAVSWKLRSYTGRLGDPLELIPTLATDPGVFMLAVETGDPAIDEEINKALYDVERTQDQGLERLTFRWSDGRGLEVVKSLGFRPGDYLVEVDLSVRDRGRDKVARLVLGPGFGAQDPSARRSSYVYSAIALNTGGTATHRYARKIKESQARGDLRWAGLEDQYFAALLIPAAPQATVALQSRELQRTMPDPETGEIATLDSEKLVTVSASLESEEALLYVGPKDFRMLRELGYGLEDAVWFSSNGMLSAIAVFLFQILLWIHGHTIANYGMAIILTTFLVRLVLFPLNQWSMVSIKKSQLQMQKLQPKMQAIRNRYKKKKDAETRAKMNQEIMDLYRKEGVNPMGGVTGCLPMLAQFPVLISFYLMLTVAIELRGAPFYLWIQDLSAPDPVWILPLLMGVTMFAQQKMAMNKVTDPTQRQQQRIMMIMPFVFTFICFSLPSGLVLYWFVNNILAIGQQYLVNRKTEGFQAAVEKA